MQVAVNHCVTSPESSLPPGQTGLSLAQFSYHRRIFAELIAEFLIHPHQKDIAGFYIIESKGEFFANLIPGTNSAASREDFESDTGFTQYF